MTRTHHDPPQRRSDARDARPLVGAGASPSGGGSDLTAARRAQPLLDELKARLAALADREAALERREHELLERAERLAKGGVDGSVAELEAARSAIAQRRDQVDKLYEQAAQIREQAARQQRAVAAKRTELAQALRRQRARLADEDARRRRDLAETDRRWHEEFERDTAQLRAELTLSERELTQQRDAFSESQMRLDIERTHLGDEALRIAEAQQRVDEDRLGLDEQLTTLEQEREQLAEQRRRIEAQQHAARRVLELGRVGLGVVQRAVRALALGALIGAAAAGAWWRSEAPMFAVTAEATIHGERTIGEHATNLVTNAFAAHFSPARAAADWRAAVEQGDVQTALKPEGATLSITLRSGDPAAGRTLLAAALDAYSSHLSANHVDVRSTPRWMAWRRRVDQMEQQRAVLEHDLRQTQERRAAIPEVATWDQTLAELNAAQAELADTRLAIADQHRIVERLRATSPAPEIVRESQVHAALRDDPVYYEDYEEYASYARQYQQELSRAMRASDDAVSALREAIAASGANVRDHMTPRLAMGTRAVLETTGADLDELERSLDAFLATWRERRAAINALNPVDELITLVKTQNEALEVAVDVASVVHAALAEFNAHVRELVELPDTGAVERVVIASLQDAQHRQTVADDAVGAALAEIDPLRNVRLDAADRQLRSLRTRLQERGRSAREELEQDAKRVAVTEHTAALGAAEKELDELTARRDDLLSVVVTRAEHLQSVEMGSRTFVEVDAEMRVLRAALARLDLEREELRAAEPAVNPTEFVASVGESRRVAGEHRERNSAIAGGGTLIAVWALSMLLFTRRTADVSLEPRSATAA